VRAPTAKSSTSPGRALTPEETDRLLAVADADRWAALWHLLVWCGPRPSEALALKWGDIDFEQATVRIERALVPVNKVWTFAATKTRRARTVPLPLPVLTALRRHQKRQEAEKAAAGENYQDQGLVFADPAGRIVPAWVFSKSWKRLLKKAGVDPTYRLYDARHTSATRLVEHGVDFKNVADVLGNSAKMIAERYGHGRLEVQREALEAIASRSAATTPQAPRPVALA